MLAGNECVQQFPIEREIPAAIETNLLGIECLGDHIMLSLPSENVRVGKVKGLAEDDLLVFPSHGVAADRQTDLTPKAFLREHLEKKIPEILGADHERIRHELRLHVRDVARGKNWIPGPAGRGPLQR